MRTALGRRPLTGSDTAAKLVYRTRRMDGIYVHFVITVINMIVELPMRVYLPIFLMMILRGEHTCD